MKEETKNKIKRALEKFVFKETEDQLRDRCEHVFYDLHNHDRYNWADVCEFEEKFKRHKKGFIKQKIATIAVATMLASSAVVCGVLTVKPLIFEETVYEAPKNYTPDYYNEFPINVYINKDVFSTKQIETIKNILAMLDEKCDGFKIEVQEEYDFGSCNISISTSKPSFKDGSIIMGYAYGNVIHNFCSEIEIDENFAKMDTKIFEHVVLHELLHALGLDHSKKVTSIMFPYVLYNDIKQEEIDALNTLYPTATKFMEDHKLTQDNYQQYLNDIEEKEIIYPQTTEEENEKSN